MKLYSLMPFAKNQRDSIQVPLLPLRAKFGDCWVSHQALDQIFDIFSVGKYLPSNTFKDLLFWSIYHSNWIRVKMSNRKKAAFPLTLMPSMFKLLVFVSGLSCFPDAEKTWKMKLFRLVCDLTKTCQVQGFIKGKGIFQN